MENSALIVAHGQPSDPAPAEADLARVAAAVAAALPDWHIGSATLAEEGALARALADLGTPVVFPFFMADGWFIRTLLPKRLAEARAAPRLILPPFGLMTAVHHLAGQAALASAQARGWLPDETTLVLAAHGSGRSPFPADAARAFQTALEPLGFAEIRLGFIEEPPLLQHVATGAGARAICLPLFVARWGHVISDIPAALAAADFRGPCLAPIGTRIEVPRLIAAALSSAEPNRSVEPSA
jgi:sirohydrochlorin ferrochelatase